MSRRVLFLFAHQDDEFGVFQAIVDEMRAGNQVFCAYLTNGAANGVSSERRNAESLAVLGRLGIPSDQVLFPGTELDIADGRLPHRLHIAGPWLTKWLVEQRQIRSIFIPAWEGGHHDHDALHALTLQLNPIRSGDIAIRQFSLYNSFGKIGPMFSVLRTIAENGPPRKRNIPIRNRVLFLRCCLGYPSQAKSWFGLFPMVFLHYLLRGYQETQPVSLERIRLRPHNGMLYYEKRGFFSWDEMERCLSSWEKTQ